MILPRIRTVRSLVWRSELALIGERWSRDCHLLDHLGERAISAISVCQRTSRREVPLASSKSDENSSREFPKLVMACGVIGNRRNLCHKDRILVSTDLSDHTAIHHESKTIEGRDAVIRRRTPRSLRQASIIFGDGVRFYGLPGLRKRTLSEFGGIEFLVS